MSDIADQHSQHVLHSIRGLAEPHVAWNALAHAVEVSNIDERSGEVTMALATILALCVPVERAKDIAGEVERVGRQLRSVEAVQFRPGRMGDRTWFVAHHAALRALLAQHARNDTAPRAPSVGRR